MTDYYKEAKDLGVEEEKKLTKEDILSFFSNKESIFFQSHIGIITSNYEKALDLFEKINITSTNVLRYFKGKYELSLYLKNGDAYTWFNPSTKARGYKFGKIYIDINVDYDDFINIVVPSCTYVSKENVHII